MTISEAAPSPSPRVHEVSSLSGLSLHVRDWGPVDGFPVIHHHGTPGSSLSVPGGWHAPAEIGVRVITFDRPGYGLSQAEPGRRVANAAEWAQAVADALGLDTFSLLGTAGGAPHAAAAAALLGSRVHKLCLVAGLGPDELPGFDPAAGALQETRHEIACARAGEGLLRPFIAALTDRRDPLGDWLAHLPAADVEILGRREVRVEDQAGHDESFRQDAEGWIDDDLALFHHSWGCDLAGVVAPTVLLHGSDDVLISAAHADAYRMALGHGQLVKLPNAGHWLRDYEPEALRWLADSGTAPLQILA